MSPNSHLGGPPPPPGGAGKPPPTPPAAGGGKTPALWPTRPVGVEPARIRLELLCVLPNTIRQTEEDSTLLLPVAYAAAHQMEAEVQGHHHHRHHRHHCVVCTIKERRRGSQSNSKNKHNSISMRVIFSPASDHWHCTVHACRTGRSSSSRLSTRQVCPTSFHHSVDGKNTVVV